MCIRDSLLIALVALIAATSMGSSAVSSADAVETAPCLACHVDTTLITGKETAWAESGHGTGTAYLRGTAAGCAGCHSGGGFSDMIAATMPGTSPNPSLVTAGDPDPTRQDCRACHEIHTSYTGLDWALETTTAVDLYAIPGNTFDGGKGNLCASCHQPRRDFPTAVGGVISGISSHWGPHHGPQSSMMLGIGGAGAAAAGTPAAHYSAVEDTCVTCHMGSGDNHSYEPEVSTCTSCHAGAENLDINGVQTAVQAKLDTLKPLLVNAGVLACSVDEEGVESCHASVSSAPEAEAQALWNYIYVANEDGSLGVHNADYTNALLDASIASMTP